MGTHSLTIFMDDKQEIAVLYGQYDGYEDGHGVNLATFLADKKIVNGISGNKPCFNGMSDLAVRTIVALKGDCDEPGNFYLHPPGTRGESYEYIINGKEGMKEATIKVNKSKPLPASEFLKKYQKSKK